MGFIRRGLIPDRLPLIGLSTLPLQTSFRVTRHNGIYNLVLVPSKDDYSIVRFGEHFEVDEDISRGDDTRAIVAMSLNQTLALRRR